MQLVYGTNIPGFSHESSHLGRTMEKNSLSNILCCLMWAFVYNDENNAFAAELSKHMKLLPMLNVVSQHQTSPGETLRSISCLAINNVGRIKKTASETKHGAKKQRGNVSLQFLSFELKRANYKQRGFRRSSGRTALWPGGSMSHKWTSWTTFRNKRSREMSGSSF